jgi:HAE1 family hydrophobic/amphiphilic exporter-1
VTERPPEPAADPGVAGGLFATVVARPVAMSMLFLSALVFGWVSYARLPIALMPDLSYPTITVRTTWDGAAPQEVETEVSQPVEEALATLDGLVSLESHSRAGMSDVVLGFDWGTDMAGAAQSIREALQTTFLPDDAERPLILRYDPSAEPFLRLGISYDADVLGLEPEPALLLLRELADHDVKRTLEGMQGVAAVRVRGGYEREIRVEVREDWMAARRLTLAEVRQALAAENVNLAGGSIYEGDTEYLVRTLNEYRSVEELRSLRVRRSDGELIPITDVAVLHETHKDRTVLSHLDGAEAVELEVYKEADANVVAVAQAVKDAVLGVDLGFTQEDVDALPEGMQRAAMQEQLDGSKALSAELPDGVKVVVLDDQAAFIEVAIDNLVEAVVLGGLLSILILYLFLRDWRATFIVGAAIPVSLVMGFAPLYLGGMSLNLMSLGGLALGVGMLVDNAIVVLEAVQRYLDEGRPRIEAAIAGSTEVGAAVAASAFASVVVFAPIGFVEGVGGELFGDLAIAVVGSQLAGLAVALFLVPTLAALGAEPAAAALAEEEDDAGMDGRWAEVREPVWAEWRAHRAWVGERPLRRGAALPYGLARLVGSWCVVFSLWLGARLLRLGGRLAGAVARLVVRPFLWVSDLVAAAFQAGFRQFALAYRAAMTGTLAHPGQVLVVALASFGVALWGFGFIGTELLPEVHQGRFVVEVALPIGTPLADTTEVVEALEAQVASRPGVVATYTTVGAEDRADTRSDEGEHTARIRVEVKDGGDIAAREEAVMADLREVLADTPRATVRFSRPALFSFRTPLEVVVFGQDLDALKLAGERAAAALAEVPGLTDVRSSLQRGHPEVRVHYDRERLARFGLDTSTVADTIRDRIQGVRATEIHAADQRLDLRVQLTEGQRQSQGDLRRLNINPAVQPPVPLESVADFEEAIGPSEIRRVDQQRAVVISASLQGFDMGTAVSAVEAAMRDVPLGDGQTWELGGQARDLSGATQSMAFAIGLAVFLVYVIMASTFENVGQPLIILFSVPLSAIGVVGALWVSSTALSVVALLGVIVLVGVVVNNAIVLVDAVNQLRSEGMDRRTALAEAAALRLRPILITASTAGLGLVPLAFGIGAGAEMQRPMAIAILGGLTTSTLLTLVVIPAIYVMVTRDGRVTR